MVDRARILREAKQIIDKFHKALASVDRLEESNVERDQCEREEMEGVSASSEFRDIMFKNSPQNRGDCIEAERGSWT